MDCTFRSPLPTTIDSNHNHHRWLLVDYSDLFDNDVNDDTPTTTPNTSTTVVRTSARPLLWHRRFANVTLDCTARSGGGGGGGGGGRIGGGGDGSGGGAEKRTRVVWEDGTVAGGDMNISVPVGVDQWWKDEALMVECVATLQLIE